MKNPKDILASRTTGDKRRETAYERAERIRKEAMNAFQNIKMKLNYHTVTIDKQIESDLIINFAEQLGYLFIDESRENNMTDGWKPSTQHEGMDYWLNGKIIAEHRYDNIPPLVRDSMY